MPSSSPWIFDALPYLARQLSVFYRLPIEGIPKAVSLGEETSRSETRRCKEHKTLDRFGPRGA
jgi:hypothetical protein